MEGDNTLKKSIVCITMLFAILVSSVAFAQDKNYEISVGGGILLPVSPKGFRDAAEVVGFNVGGGVGFFVKPQLTIGGEVWYNRFGEDGGNRTLSFTEILGTVKYYFQSANEGSANVYVLGSAGLGRSDIENFGETDGMIGGGVGVKFGSSTSFFVEGRFNAVFNQGDNTTYFPVRGGIVF